MNKPVDFLIAGVQKAGTTALHAVLSRHDDIFMPAVKELHFFDQEDATNWKDPHYRHYDLHFADAARGHIRGEATPSYLYWPDSLERIAAYNPAVKLIVLLRQPVARAHSHWVMERARSNEELDFSEAIRSGRDRLRTDANAWRGHHKNLSYVERGFYASQLERAFALFPQDQVLVLLHDDLVTDPDRLLGRIAAFLGVGAIDGGLLRDRHSLTPHLPGVEPMADADEDYLKQIFRADVLRLKTLIAEDVSRWDIA